MISYRICLLYNYINIIKGVSLKYTIYKTTNLINEKYYIGMHKTEDLNDDYLGSGVALKNAIKKYGRENFIKEILFIFETEQEMKDKEMELVNEDVVNDVFSYNMKIGGIGGWPDTSGKNNPNYGKALWKKGKTQEEIDAINAKRASHGEANGMFGKTHTDEAKAKIIAANQAWLKTAEGKAAKKKQAEELSKRMKGKPKSEEQKRKMSESAKKRWENIPVVVCPHCGKEGKGSAMKQWHFNNCKHKVN